MFFNLEFLLFFNLFLSFKINSVALVLHDSFTWPFSYKFEVILSNIWSFCSINLSTNLEILYLQNCSKLHLLTIKAMKTVEKTSFQNSLFHRRRYLLNIFLIKVDNKNTTKSCKICSKLTVKTPERDHWLWYWACICSWKLY